MSSDGKGAFGFAERPNSFKELGIKVYLQKIRQIGKACVRTVCGIEVKADERQRGARHIGKPLFPASR
ncbi:hypothetical protein [Treponema endosymbiont of Eucomonympha sp.]|uniref:hypothetical protein n=1 Tax=Treponema endosymbiont of Eucomonympha sp. TaxID=1580831 RepID=UPI0007819158|nr:hypothetical protein [Treponema endosymbiont of Eucomonympha sp.]